MSTNRVGYLTPEIYTLEDSNTRVLMNSMDSSPDIFDTDIECPAESTGDKKHEFIPWGEDNEYPYHLMDAIGRDEVMSQNKHFNVLTCYGSGLIYRDLKTKLPTTDAEIKAFMRRNAFPRFFLEQATDMKFFFFSVAVIILSKDGKKIVTPKSNSILPSITRRSLLVVAKDYLGLEVEERQVNKEELADFAEVGLCGTAAVISPIGQIDDHGKSIMVPSGMDSIGPVLGKLRETLTGIQMGELKAPEGWVVEIQ